MLHLCHSVHEGGVCLSACWDKHPRSDTRGVGVKTEAVRQINVHVAADGFTIYLHLQV